MTDPQRMTREEWLTARRAEWQASGTDLDFDAWQAAKLAERREEDDRRVEARIAAERRNLLIQRLERQIPARYADATVTDPTLARWADELIKLDETSEKTGPSVLVVGPTGTGKTHAMFGAIRRYVLGGGERPATCITAADLYAKLRPHAGRDSEDAFTTYANSWLLAIDDLGAAKGSEWTDEINYRLLNHRYNAKLATLLTSNLPPNRLADTIGDRVASRLAEMCETVVLKGDDRRRNRGSA